MTPEVVLIEQPAIDFDRLLTIANQALGYSPARGTDAARRELSQSERFVSILAAIEDEAAGVGLSPRVLGFIQFGVVLVADTADLLDIVLAGGMPTIAAPTVRPGISLAFMAGTMSQWRDAVITGTETGGNVRAFYCKCLTLFERLGLADVWSEYKRTPQADLFLLERK